jgi:protein O-mannosyl-transferase
MNRLRAFVGSERRREAMLCVLLAVMMFAAFLPLLRADFIAYDDQVYVTNNARIQQGITWPNVQWAFSTTYFGFYYPITWLSHMLDCQFYGLWAPGHHLTSLLIHIVNALLLFLFLHKVTGTTWRSFFVGVFFALHPLHVESVAWIAERKDVLSTLFFMLVLIAYAWYCRRPGTGRYLAMAALFALGLMAKPMIVTAPVLMVLMDYWPLGRWRPGQSLGEEHGVEEGVRPRSFTFLILEKVPLLVMSTLAGLATLVTQSQLGAVVSVEHVPIILRMKNALLSYAVYLMKTLYPIQLAIHYPLDPAAISWQKVLAAGVGLVLVSVAAVLLSKRVPYLVVGWLWYLIVLLPVIGILQVGAQASADHYTYLSLIGIFIAMTWGAQEALRRYPWGKRAFLTGAVVLSILWAAMTWRQAGFWRDSMTIFGRALEVTKNNPKAEDGYGLALMRSGRVQEAIPHFQRSVKIWRGYAVAWTNLGVAYFRMGDLVRAESCLWRANRLKPGDPEVIETLAECCLQRGHPQEIEADLKAVVALQPDRLESRFVLGNVLASQGKRREALAQFEEILERDPRNVPALSARGQVQLELNLRKDAEASFSEALKLDAGAVAALTGLSRTLVVPDAPAQDLARAVALAKKACEATQYRSPLPLQALLSACEAAGLTVQAEDLKVRMRNLGLKSLYAPPGLGAGTDGAP